MWPLPLGHKKLIQKVTEARSFPSKAPSPGIGVQEGDPKQTGLAANTVVHHARETQPELASREGHFISLGHNLCIP